MSFRRYEILLPTRYNDGSPVPPEKIDEVLQDLAARFGGVTFRPEHLLGVWLYENRRFEEHSVCFVTDVEDTDENAQFFSAYKQTLKERFRQLDIWIVSYEIHIT